MTNKPEKRQSVFPFITRSPYKWQFIIGVTTAIALLFNFFSLKLGEISVSNNLLYIPIVIAAYAYPRRGTVFALAISGVYLLMVYGIRAAYPQDLFSSSVRFYMFVLVGVVVSYLSMRIKKEEIVITIVMAIIVLILASSAMYTVERDVQPEEFGSIPDAMWWAVMTLATVGYGDAVPITPVGKFLAAIVAISSIGLFALPAGILASGFAESLRGKRESNETDKILACPQCGAEIDLQTGRVRERPGDTNTAPLDDGEILEELLR